MIEYTPLADRVIVKPIEAETKTSSGILLAENAQKRMPIGKVIGVGKQIEELKVGDTVIYPAYGAAEIEINGETILILKEEDILAKHKGGKK